jgi:AraC-like DNA-binding protein
MSSAIRVLAGNFGRVALLRMTGPLVEHAHRHCHVLIKVSGHDTGFLVCGEPRALVDDNAVMINAWEPHCYAHPEGAPETIILALYIEPRWLAEGDSRYFGAPASVFFSQKMAALSARTRQQVNRFIDLLLGGESVDPADLDTLLFGLLVALAAKPEPDRPSTLVHAPSDFRIRRAIGFLKENVGSRFEVDDLVRTAGLSRPHFYSLFKQCTGLSPGMYFNVLRMEEAIKRLSGGTQPIGNLSFDLGFEAQSTFTRFFRQHQGASPTEFRRVVDCVIWSGP